MTTKLQKQQDYFEKIKTLCTNYKKDGSSRKNLDYLKNKLTTLDALWGDFENLHKVPHLGEIEEKNIKYFQDNIFENTKTMYEATKSDIMKLIHLTEERSSIKFDLTGFMDDGQNEDVMIRLNKQECNFKAIDRAMSKIDITANNEKWELEENLNILKSKWSDIDKLHWEIDGLLRGCHETYYTTFVDIETKYDHLRKLLNSKIWSTIHYQQTAPRIQIPEFSGSYNQWISFKDLFIETVHNNPTINKAQKMQHLKTKLRGEAERLVQHLTINADNYQSCWDILNQRYDNRRLQFISFMNTMLNLPTIQQPDAYNLKKMHDIITECLSGLTNIGLDISTWDPIIVHLMTQKLDTATHNDYIRDLRDHREVPNLGDFLYFLEGKFMAYETMKRNKKDTVVQQKPSFVKTYNKEFPVKQTNYNYYKTSKTYHTTYGQCPLCDGEHVLMQCQKFIDQEPSQRNNTVAKLQVCKNCLFSHGDKECRSSKTCKECNLKHHSLLHNTNTFKKQLSNSYFRKYNSEPKPSTSTQQASTHHLATKDMEVLLTTVKLQLQSFDGTFITLRALLDQGSQVNLVTENAAQLLKLPRKQLNATVSGIGNLSGNCKGKTLLTCKSLHSGYTFKTEALILNRITNNLPNKTFKKIDWPHLENLKLADADYNESRPVDLLLGADVYADILMEGVLKGDPQAPIAQQTHLGWILCGKLITFNCHVTLINTDELTKFWENEDIAQNYDDSPQNEQCEEYYKKTVQRGADGKYTVKMPLSPNFEENLGSSKQIAISQFLQLERRLQKKTKLAEMYKNFIKEYSDLHHMKPATSTSTEDCFLPHHGVLRDNATTTKLRVVFNASQKTSSGHSLNSLQEKGPKLQNDIQALILKWRSYKYVYTADVEMMYRCIWISADQQHLQKIIWRNSPSEKLQEYQLCTITYGLKCAPWLAMRTLKQLAMDDGHKHPAAAEILLNSFYVDDLISGHNSIEEAKQLQQSLINLLQGGGMNLRKWSSNHPALLEDLTENQISTRQIFDFKHEESMKTLGLGWNPNTDTFNFSWNLSNQKESPITKRVLLSEISRLYDPLDWYSAVTVTAKLIFQKVWSNQKNWDESLPVDIQKEWLKLKRELPILNKIKLNRWIGTTSKQIELLGYCDASEKAFACVIYIRVKDEHGKPRTSLLAAKTRVAAISQKITLLKLELCGSLLLSQLMKKTMEAYKEFDITVRAWCDSQVVLAWLQGEESRWERYVANRVTKIKQIIPAENWQYIKSEQNPADCASRGMYPSKLINFDLWWNGPSHSEIEKINKLPNLTCHFTTNIGTLKKEEATLDTEQNKNFIYELLENHSSLTKIIRVTSWILRFTTRLRNTQKCDTSYLTTKELSAATELITRHAQQMAFPVEYKLLLKNKTVTKNSPIYKLKPYLDEKGIIRVGGRLNHSNLPPGMKNPTILPRKARITHLVIHPGADGYVRVVTLKTQSGTFKRSIVKLAPLPIEINAVHEEQNQPTNNKVQENNVKKPARPIIKNNSGKRSLLTLFTTLLTMSALVSGSHAGASTSAHITRLESERPIYYDTMGKIQVIHNEWTLLMFYNLTNYWEGTSRIATYLNGLSDWCQKTDPRYCKTTLNQLFHEMELLQYYNTVLITTQKHLSKRKKRGLMDGVGYLTNSLFGILDQRFAEKYKNDIKAVQNNENYLLELIKNQTSIVELENQILEKSEANIKRQFDVIENFMNETNINLAKIETEIEAVMATAYFNSAALSAYLLINNLKNVQEMLFNTLTDVYKGRIDVHLVTPVNLITQMNVIAGKLPRTLSLPVDNVRDDIKNLYKLLHVKARVTESFFLFEVHIPLISDEDFTLHRAIPLPVKTNTGTFSVQTSSRYIAVNFQKNTYISLKEEDLKQCIQLQLDNFICNKNLPVFNLHNDNIPCDPKLIGHRTTSPCDVTRTSCKDAWIELHTPNAWLAICCDTCSLRAICEDDITSHTLTSSGIVTLSQGCMLQSRDLTIHSLGQYNSKVKMDYGINVPTVSSPINRIANITYHTITHLYRHQSEDHEDIDEKLSFQKRKEEHFPSELTTHDIHQYAICYFLLVVAIAAAILWGVGRRYPQLRSCLTRRKECSLQSVKPHYEDIELQPIPRKREAAKMRSSQEQRSRQLVATNDNVAFNFD